MSPPVFHTIAALNLAIGAFNQHARTDVPAQDTTGTLSWVLGRDEGRAGEVFDTWIIADGTRNAALGAQLRLLSPSIATAWLRTEAETCRDAKSRNHKASSVTFKQDTLVYACVLPSHRGVLRLVAIKSTALADGRIAQHIAVSDPYRVASRYALSPALFPALTAAFGFLAGILAHILQSAWDRRVSAKRHIEELRKAVAENLVPEISDNLSALTTYLHTPGEPPPDLAVDKYNVLLGDNGVMSYLEEKYRKRYFAALQRVYRNIEDYTDRKNSGQLPEARATAELLRNMLRNLTTQSSEASRSP
jgi:hypothetical protein